MGLSRFDDRRAKLGRMVNDGARSAPFISTINAPTGFVVSLINDNLYDFMTLPIYSFPTRVGRVPYQIYFHPVS